MVQIIAIVLLICLAFYTSGEVHRERVVFEQEHQTTAVQTFVWLFPVPFILPLLHRSFWTLFFPFPVGAAFFAPAIAVAIANRNHFDRSPNPDVKPAARAVDNVITFGIMGVMGMFAFTAWLWFRRR